MSYVLNGGAMTYWNIYLRARKNEKEKGGKYWLVLGTLNTIDWILKVVPEFFHKNLFWVDCTDLSRDSLLPQQRFYTIMFYGRDAWVVKYERELYLGGLYYIPFVGVRLVVINIQPGPLWSQVTTEPAKMLVVVVNVLLCQVRAMIIYLQGYKSSSTVRNRLIWQSGVVVSVNCTSYFG